MPSITEDRDEIVQLLHRYNHAVDSADGIRWADTFTDDAVFEAGGRVMVGREELAAFGSSMSNMRHVVANPVIDVTGDTATVHAYVFVFRGRKLSVVGEYKDEVVRTPAGWRFAKRVFAADPPD